jgi:hypothetical protein
MYFSILVEFQKGLRDQTLKSRVDIAKPFVGRVFEATQEFRFFKEDILFVAFAARR